MKKKRLPLVEDEIKETLSLLKNKNKLVMQPELATQIGLHEAIILQQLEYWLKRSNNLRDGRKWVYKSFREWNQEMPFMPRSTISDAVRNLVESKLIIVSDKNYNKRKYDRTNWYSINSDEYIINEKPCTGPVQPCTIPVHPYTESRTTIPEITTENTSKENPSIHGGKKIAEGDSSISLQSEAIILTAENKEVLQQNVEAASQEIPIENAMILIAEILSAYNKIDLDFTDKKQIDINKTIAQKIIAALPEAKKILAYYEIKNTTENLKIFIENLLKFILLETKAQKIKSLGYILKVINDADIIKRFFGEMIAQLEIEKSKDLQKEANSYVPMIDRI